MLVLQLCDNPQLLVTQNITFEPYMYFVLHVPVSGDCKMCTFSHGS